MKKEINEFLEAKTGYLARRSIRTYRRNLELFAEVVQKPLEKVAEKDLSKAIQVLAARYKDTTVQNIMNSVHALFKFWGPERKCLNHERVHVPRALATPRYAATDEDFGELKKAIDSSTPRGLQQLVVLHLLWYTGMRIGELVSLKISDVDLERSCALVKTEKTYAFREVFWGEETQIAIQKYLAFREHLNRGPYLFISLNPKGPRSEHLNRKAIQRWFREWTAEQGLSPRLVPHSFRHSRIQRWFAADLNAYEVIMLSGHRSVMSLSHYMRLSHPQNAANARRAMNVEGVINPKIAL